MLCAQLLQQLQSKLLCTCFYNKISYGMKLQDLKQAEIFIYSMKSNIKNIR